MEKYRLQFQSVDEGVINCFIFHLWLSLAKCMMPVAKNRKLEEALGMSTDLLNHKVVCHYHLFRPTQVRQDFHQSDWQYDLAFEIFFQPV